MKRQGKSVLVLTMILFPIVFFLGVNAFSGEPYIPAPPDKNKTPAAKDGGPDGCNSSRFKCVMGGEAVLDKQTGLTWARNANLAGGTKAWQEAEKFCQDVEIGNQKGWRLPTKEEMITLLDTSQSNPALPVGHPFKNYGGASTIQSTYWTSTTLEGNGDIAYSIAIYLGRVSDELKIFEFRIWPVLGGKY